jgi:hypothetical protein
MNALFNIFNGLKKILLKRYKKKLLTIHLFQKEKFLLTRLMLQMEKGDVGSLFFLGILYILLGINHK